MLTHSWQEKTSLVGARSAFRRAHAAAKWRGLLGRALRRCVQLCSLSDAIGGHRQAVVPNGVAELEEVEIDRIVGSVGRARDYTAGFLPRVSRDEERWALVLLAVDSPEGVPPIELNELDGEFYVVDGHHRVSVLKRLGIRSVEAYVSHLARVSA